MRSWNIVKKGFVVCLDYDKHELEKVTNFVQQKQGHIAWDMILKNMAVMLQKDEPVITHIPYIAKDGLYYLSLCEM